MRTIQGKFDPTLLLDNVNIPYMWSEYIYHVGRSLYTRSIIHSGLIAGRTDTKGRQRVFFTALDPMSGEQGKCTKPSCDYWHSPQCVKHKTSEGCKFGEICTLLHSDNSESPDKKTKTDSKADKKQQLLFYAVFRSWFENLRMLNHCQNQRLDLRTRDGPSWRKAAKDLGGQIAA